MTGPQRGDETTTIPRWLWTAAGIIAITFAGALGTWVGGTLIDHETRIGRTEERVDGVREQMKEVKLGLEKIDGKLDRLLER
jgi:hypothetical protein